MSLVFDLFHIWQYSRGMKRKKIDWLLQEMKALKGAGIISSETLTKIENNYKESGKKKNLKNIALTIFGILGGLLVGGGIVLLLAHNWNNLSRNIRVALFLGPLFAMQVISGVILFRNISSQVWRETIGIIYFILIGASIAMINQIYQTAGDLETFLLKWAIGGLPVVYFLWSEITAVIYIIVITAWAVIAQDNGGNAVLYWPLFAAVLPKLIHTIINYRNSHRRELIEYVIIISLTVSLGITLEKVLPGLWIVVYSGFFVLLFLLGDIYKNQVCQIQPSRIAGITGTVVISVLLLINDFWEDVGFKYIRDGFRFHEGAAFLDYFLIAVIIASIVYLYASRKIRPGLLNIAFTSVFIAALTAFLYPKYGPFIFHLFTMLLGFALLIPAVNRIKETFYTNIGLLLICLSLLIMIIENTGINNYQLFICSCLLTVMFIKSCLFVRKAEINSERVWKVVCLILGLPLIYSLSFIDTDILGGKGFLFNASIMLLPLSIIIAGTLFQLIPYLKKEKINAILISIFPAITFLKLILNIDMVILYNLYLLVIGIAVIFYGIYRENLAIANGGILINVLLIATRFFDIDMSFTGRGISFICIGIFFLVTNIFISRKIKRERIR